MRVQVPESTFGNLLGYRESLAGGDLGTIQTIRVMRKLVDQAVSDPEFVRHAIELVRNVPEHDENGEIFALYSFVHDYIRYTKDPVTKEVLVPPKELLRRRAGDCDDTSMLIAALAIALGYPARLVTISANPEHPNDFSHIYPEVELPPGSGSWVALDVARPGAQFGLSPASYFRKRAWSLIDDSHSDLNGCTRMSGLAGYTRLGQLSETDQLISQVVAETPQLMAVAQGNPTYNAGGIVATGSPYTSFVAPGMVTQPAGYSAQTQVSSLGSLLPLLLIGGLIFLVAR